TGRPVPSAEAVHEFTERIINPRPPRKRPVAPPAPQPRAEWEQEPPQQEVSRARAIFNAAEEAKPFNPADFDFAMVDEEPSMEAQPTGLGSSPATSLPRSKPPSKRMFGMTPLQLAIIAALALALVCILAGFAYVVSIPS